MQAEELLSKIYEIVGVLSEQNMDSLSGDTLSRIAVKLASYKATLGEHRTDAKYNVWNTEAAYKLAKAEGYAALRAEGQNSTDSKELKETKATEQLAAYNEARKLESQIVGISQDVHDLIDAIKGRVINLQTERSESRVG